MNLNTEIKKCEDNRVKIKCTVDKQNVSSELTNVYSAYAKKYKFPGFRPGKAPRPVVEAAVGKEPILADATQNVLDKAYRQLVNDEGLEPVSSPNFEGEENETFVEDKKPFTFEFSVEVPQVCELKSYDNFEAFIPESKATDKEVDEQVKQFISYMPDVDAEPKDLTDEVVKEKFGFETVKDMREKIAEMIEEQKFYQINNIKDFIISRLIAERVPVEPTEKEIETVNIQTLSNFYRDLQQNGITLDQYLAQRQMTADDFYDDMKAQSTDEAKTRIGLDAWAKHFNIEALDADIDEEFEKAGMTDVKNARKEFADRGTFWELKQSIRRAKTINKIVEDAKWTEDTEKFDKQQEKLASETSLAKNEKKEAKEAADKKKPAAKKETDKKKTKTTSTSKKSDK